MKIQTNLRYIWLSLGVLSMTLLAFHWFGYDSPAMQNTILVLNGLTFVLAIPCSLFVIPVVVSASYFMAIGPLSADGIYLNTIFLFVIGMMQWFWIARFWSPTQPQLQSINSVNL